MDDAATDPHRRTAKIIVAVLGAVLVAAIAVWFYRANAEDQARNATWPTVSSSTTTAPGLSAQDTAYYLTLDHYGLNLSHETAASMGVALCSILADPSETVAEAGTQLMAMNPSWSAEDAGHFLGAATTRYCPDKAP